MKIFSFRFIFLPELFLNNESHDLKKFQIIAFLSIVIIL